MTIVLLRTLIIFVSILVFMRGLGKRQLGELEISELVVSVLIADLAAIPLQDIGIPLLNGIVPIAALFACELILSGIAAKSVKLRALLFGRPCMLVKNGVIQQDAMRRCRFTVDELAEELRGSGILDISAVRYAVLETDGSLSIILSAADSPATAGQLGLDVSDAGYPCIVIDEGRVMSDNLRALGLDERWLEKELKNRGASSPKDVYIMAVYDSGRIFYAEKERKK